MEAGCGVITFEFDKPMPAEDLFDSPEKAGLITRALGSHIEMLVGTFFARAVDGPQGLAAAALTLARLEECMQGLRNADFNQLTDPNFRV